mmetsp:Transcript_7280/g.16509  ORF Transcript_7280/g.16509 Transcript_7280/m.16509 type:complete len:289 (+) Transcript_7280:74-940(+)|eukprot:CAMPEP_0197889748 /NCGR_PEP_ID=MMETSP1439-20131203/24502_1 /TAXON_ID=66791 /ORGANISM="Gonyaulax spinifera, Strain CCMP409" /LENGTH=288 /DNA_ID=CAMNT_0043509733 /DNA_START=69 /DNA_END=935 /DNA_ORIENTATION=+
MKSSANEIALAAAVFILALYVWCEVGPRAVLTFTEKKAWAWEITAMGYMMKVAQDNRAQVEGFYWVKALTVTAIAAFGGGFLAPLLVAHNPVPLMEETYLWMVVAAWYIVHHVPIFSDFLSEVMRSEAGKILFTVLFGIFKTNQIVGAVELSVKAVAAEHLLPASRYFKTPIMAPILCGFLGGCGGAFLPFSKSLTPIEEGKTWNIRAAFLAPIIYYWATRGFGVDPLNAKMVICLFRICGDLFPATRDSAVGSMTSLAYVTTGVRPASLPSVVKVTNQASAKATDGR